MTQRNLDNERERDYILPRSSERNDCSSTAEQAGKLEETAIRNQSRNGGRQDAATRSAESKRAIVIAGKTVSTDCQIMSLFIKEYMGQWKK